MATVRALAALGPREATSDAYRRAADIVEGELTELGYDVTRQSFRVPRGISWGVPVGAGDTVNVVARPPDLRPDQPHIVVGAHLDTVPQAPGAEDNASGIAVLLELARLAQATATRLPAVFVAFGAEEPRGPADDEHHFGSQTYVRRLGAAEAAGLVAMVSLDRVGAPGSVPVCTGGQSPRRVQRGLLEAAERIDVPARACDNRTSDHWPFEKAGHVVARLGGNDSPGYHSPQDLPRTVSPRQLARSGGVLWEWLRQA
jgi:Iap family predicted aminopeptidase